jgi:EAL domain-containing protein (putative c-di-GMP-specific phosphodiesterase class I)
LQTHLADSYQVDEHILYATPSIGIGLYPDDGQDPGTLLRNADTAMYHAKKAGRNNHQFYAPKMNASAGERLQLENALRQAIASITPESSEFALHFQPQIDARSGAVTAVEALLRWNNPKLGAISPARFIPLAEESGLMQPLGDWVIWEACHHARLFHDAGLAIRMSINVSAQQLRHENLLLLIQGAMACYDLQPGDIELEITESAVMQNPDKTLQLLHQIAASGITLAIDDFGTGYSSLAYLKHMPIRRLKLDRSFVKDLESNHSDAAICSATIALGHKLGLELVAEGIETAGQQDYLTRQECDLLQGFFFSRPLPARELIEFVRHYPVAGA